MKGNQIIPKNTESNSPCNLKMYSTAQKLPPSREIRILSRKT